MKELDKYLDTLPEGEESPPDDSRFLRAKKLEARKPRAKGFQALSPARRKEIASQGGKARKR